MMAYHVLPREIKELGAICFFIEPLDTMKRHVLAQKSMMRTIKKGRRGVKKLEDLGGSVETYSSPYAT